MSSAVNSASSTNDSPRYSHGDDFSGTPPRRTSKTASSSPWTQVVRGELGAIADGPPPPPSPPSDLVQHMASSSNFSLAKVPYCLDLSSPLDPPEAENLVDFSDNITEDCNAAKKHVWNKPLNDSVDVNPVMGAFAWPALSESARASPRSFSESLKSTSPEGSSIIPPQVFVPSLSPPPQKQANINGAQQPPSPNHGGSPRQKFSRRSFGIGTGSSSPLPAASPNSGAENAPTNRSPREHAHRNVNWESGQRGPHSHVVTDNIQQRGSFRRGNGSPHPRGDGSFHHNYGGRRDQDRGNLDWNPQRNFNGRDGIQPQRVVPRAFIRPPSPHTPTFLPSPVRPFGNPMGFELASPMVYIPPESFRGVPFMAPIPSPPMLFHHVDPQLHAKVVKQIDYYFSNDNLVKDTYLRQNMDDQGWVPIKLVAGFNKVRSLTDNLQLILEFLRNSAIVEVQGDRIRRRGDWMRWFLPPAALSSPGAAPEGVGGGGGGGDEEGRSFNKLFIHGSSAEAEVSSF